MCYLFFLERTNLPLREMADSLYTTPFVDLTIKLKIFKNYLYLICYVNFLIEIYCLAAMLKGKVLKQEICKSQALT